VGGTEGCGTGKDFLDTPSTYCFHDDRAMLTQHTENGQNMTNLMLEWFDQDGSTPRYGQDQDFLGAEVWPRMRDKHFAHDVFCCAQFPHGHGFPTPRSDKFEHVGQVFFGNDQPRETDIELIRGVEAPPACRRKQEWVYG